MAGGLTCDDVEEVAVEAVRDRFRRMDGYRAHLSTNDRTPIYDGQITFNDDAAGSNRGYRGCVRVQVKGRQVDRLDDEHCRFQVEKTDLNAFQCDEGALFLVVEIERQSRNKRIFYRSFPPLHARFIVAGLGSQNAVGLRFDRLPDDDNQVIRIVHLLRDSRFDFGMVAMAGSSRDEPRALKLQMVDPVDMNQLGDVSIVDLTHGDNRALSVGADGRCTPLDAPFLAIFRQSGNEPSWRDASIGAGDAVFYHRIGSYVENDLVCLHIGPMTIHLDRAPHPDGDEGKVSVPIASDVKIRIQVGTVPDEAIRNLRFLRAVRDNDGIIENNHKPLFRLTVGEETWRGIEREFDEYTRLKRLLHHLGVATNQDIGEVNQRTLDILYQGIIENKPFPMESRKDSAMIKAVYLGNQRIALLYNETRERDSYHICDPFGLDSLETEVLKDGDPSDIRDGLRYATSIYMVMSAKALAQIENTHPENVVESFRKAFKLRKRHPEGTWDAIETNLLADARQTVGRMLQGADMISRGEVKPPNRMKRAKWRTMITMAHDLNDWIAEFNPTDDPVTMIDRMQIKFRLNELSDRDRNQIEQLMGNSDDRRIHLACRLLLGQSDAASEERSMLSEEEAKGMSKYPINNLFQPQEVMEPVVTEPVDKLPEIVRKCLESTPAEMERLMKSEKMVEVTPAVHTTRKTPGRPTH